MINMVRYSIEIQHLDKTFPSLNHLDALSDKALEMTKLGAI